MVRVLQFFFVSTEENFRRHADKFPFRRKFLSDPSEIPLLPEARFSPP